MLKNENIEVKIWNELSIARNNPYPSKLGILTPASLYLNRIDRELIKKRNEKWTVTKY